MFASEFGDLCEWHVLKWHDAVGQLTRCYSNAVNVGLCVITAQVLHSMTQTSHSFVTSGSAVQ